MCLIALLATGNVAIVSVLALLGAGTLMIAVLAPRMKGTQTIGWTKITLNLREERRVKADVVAAEAELASGKPLITLADIVDSTTGEAHGKPN